MKSMLIVGSSGFLGRSLVALCRRQGIRTIGVDRSGGSVPADERPDVACAVDVAGEFDRLPERVDAAVFAAQGPPARADDPSIAELFRINAVGVARLLAVLRVAGGVPLMHCSTGSVYRAAWQPIDESGAVRGDDPYALSKLQAEAMAGMHAGHVPMVNLRIFGLYGPRQRQRLVPGIVGRVRRGEKVSLAAGPGGKPDGGLRISLLHVEDAATAFIEIGRRMLDHEPLPGVLNLASDDAPDVRTMAMEAGGLLGTEPVFEHAPARNGDLIADTRALTRFVRAPRRSFAQGLAEALAEDPSLGAA
ncbi:MAG: hypothetical protein RLZ94_241 [Actinomycetota bacterium]